MVRPYALTGGRVRAPAGLDMLAYVTAETEAAPVPAHRRPRLAPEHRAILDLVREPVTVAEIAAHMDLALGVVRVLIGDLLDATLVSVREPSDDQELLSDEVLQAVIRGLRAL